MKKILIPIIIALTIVTIFGYRFYSNAVRYALDPDSADRVVINIKQGDMAGDVAQQLYEKGLIKNVSVFNFYLDQKGLEEQVKAGRIVVQENYTLPEIVDALIEGKTTEMAVTILEGWTIQQIADYMAGLNLTTAEEFMDCIETCEFEGDFIPEDYLEGYLYPDTYFVDPGSYTNERFIQRLINNFETRLKDSDKVHLEYSNISLEDVIIMASIVEREERDPEERPTVAAILWNRYDVNVGLGADATVLYALGRTKGGLSYDDLQIDSPYNTRKYAGLPPTPICNPSISSIEAAYSPEQTNHWYYLHDSDGVVHYANTLDEHNANKARYIN